MHRLIRWTALGLATIATTAACGSGSGGGDAATQAAAISYCTATPPASPTTNGSHTAAGAELKQGIKSLGKASNLHISLTSSATGASVLALVKELDPSAGLTAAQAGDLASIDLTAQIEAPKGQQIKDITSLSGLGAASLTLADSGTTLVSLRYVNKVIYLQGDVKDLLDRLGASSMYAKIDGLQSQLPSYAQALLAGHWVSITTSQVTQVINKLTGGKTSAGTGAGISPQSLLNRFLTGLLKDTTVTKSTTGTTTTMTLTGNTCTFAHSLIASGPSIAGASTITSKVPTTKIPDRKVSIAATLAGGSLSGVSLDLGQLGSGSAHVPVTVAVSTAPATITAPAGATAVQPTSLISLIRLGSALG